jgi:rifampicin phosphotransferase
VTGPNGLVLPLDGHGAQVTQVGGKGAWLDRLAAAGFDVPRAVALTTDAYREVVASAGLAELVAALVAGAVPDPDAQSSEEQRIDDAFLSIDLPHTVERAIAEAANRCRDDGRRLALAARSSATAEDMATTSFAGQYRSFLDLATAADVERAVRLVWASLWYPAPRAYRRYHGVDESQIAMAVVLMPMVAAEKAGVAFTVDPGGRADHVRVETVRGLGEQLVGGKVTPSVSLVPRERAERSRADDEGGVDPLAVEVADLALAVEAALGGPQDIEWAWDSHRLLLLQARPITTSAADAIDDDGYDTPSGDDRRWTTAGIAEMLPGVLSPLQWDTIGFMLEQAFRRLFAEMNALPPLDPDARMIGRFRARAAVNLGLLEQIALALPGGSPDEIERQYFGRSTGERPVTESARRSTRWQSARHDLVMLGAHRLASREAEITVEAVDRLLDTSAVIEQSAEELLVDRWRLLDLAGRAVAAEVAIAASAVTAYRRLEAWLARRFESRQAARWAQRLTAGMQHDAWWMRVPADADDAEVIEMARRAGSTAVFGGPTWDEQLEMDRRAGRRDDGVWSMVRSVSEGDRVRPRDDAWPAVVEAVQALPNWNRTRTLTGQVVDVRLSMLRRLVDDAVELLERREQTKAAVLALGGEVRRVELEIGRLLTADRLLERAEDVQLLGERELIDACRGSCPSMAELGRRRRWLDRCRAEGELPQQFRGRPGVPTAPHVVGHELHGWAAGPGVYTGRARVLRTPVATLNRGEVLVAPTTDASWSPLFLLAGAIVVEQGGPLSHAAIVARELGIPAVLNVPGATTQLADRDELVTVDGDRGVVVIGNGAGESAHDNRAGATDAGSTP